MGWAAGASNWWREGYIQRAAPLTGAFGLPRMPPGAGVSRHSTAPTTRQTPSLLITTNVMPAATSRTGRPRVQWGWQGVPTLGGVKLTSPGGGGELSSS